MRNRNRSQQKQEGEPEAPEENSTKEHSGPSRPWLTTGLVIKAVVWLAVYCACARMGRAWAYTYSSTAIHKIG